MREVDGTSAMWWPPLLPRGRRSRKLIRRLLVVLVLLLAYGHYFGPGPENNGFTGSAGPGDLNTGDNLSGNPKEAISSLYESVAAGNSVEACSIRLFEDVAKKLFGQNMGGTNSTCEGAVVVLEGVVQKLDPLVNIPDKAITRDGRRATVSSCELRGVTGRLLGAFEMTMIEGRGWIISGHRPEPSPCPVR